MASTTLFRSQAPRYMRQLIADFGFSVEDAAAIMGNAGEESAGFTKMQEVNPIHGGEGGLGPFQWTGPRRDAYEAWCKRMGWAPSSYEAAYSFLWRELHGAEKKAVEAVKSARTLEDKVKAFELAFERADPNYKHYDVRNYWARIALKAYKDVHVDPVPTPDPIPVPTPVPTPVPVDPPTLPWYKSPVFVGASTAVMGLIVTLMQVWKPGVPLVQQWDTLGPPIVAFLGATTATLKRFTATAQPITT